MDEKWHAELKQYADNKEIIFCSSPTYLDAVKILQDLSVDFIKIASAQIGTFPQLIKAVAATKIPSFFSTGIATYEDISRSVAIFEEHANKNYAILHCNSQYPTPYEKVYLRMIDTYKKMFECPVGFSDHTSGTAVVLAAVALGADIIEKHFKIDRNCNSPDAAFSILPTQFQAMVEEIHQVKSACQSKPRIFVDHVEDQFKSNIYYKIVLRRKKYLGDTFYEDDFDFLRTADGISATQACLIANNFLAACCLEVNTVLQWKHLAGK